MTPRRIELLLERRRAVRSSGLTLWQMEKLSMLDEYDRAAFTPEQRWLWHHIVWPISGELGDYEPPDEEDEDFDYA